MALLGLPRLLAAVETAVHDQTLRDLGEIRRKREIPDAELVQAGRSRAAAIGWHQTPEAWADLGAVRLMQAWRAGYGSEAGRQLLDQSVIAHREALFRSPVQPFAWTRLAQAMLAREGTSPALGPILRMAVLTGSHEPKLVLARLDIAFAAWPLLDRETTALMEAQIRLAAEWQTVRLARLARQRFALAIVRQALAQDPALRDRFDRAWRRA